MILTETDKLRTPEIACHTYKTAVFVYAPPIGMVIYILFNDLKINITRDTVTQIYYF
jgi:hypothetical protein